MPERHTIDFRRTSFNVLSDEAAGLIRLQFDSSSGGLKAIVPILKAIRRRFGNGLLNRLNRWRNGQTNPFLLGKRTTPHTDDSSVICYEITLKPGERMDPALGLLFEFLRQQPDYQRTLGPPLDRDDLYDDPTDTVTSADTSRAAGNVLRKYFYQHH